MAGAIIPDDWDGVTFACQRIEWPSSEKWRAILLGSVSEPAQESYWDSETGDPLDAARAVYDAYDKTVPIIYTSGCDDVLTNIPVPTFRAYKDTGLSLLASTWTEVPWDVLEWDLNSPNFVLVDNAHEPVGEAKLGIWNYHINLKLTTSNLMFARAILNPGAVDLALTGSDDGHIAMSFFYPHQATGKNITVQVWSVVASGLDFQQKNCHFSGANIGAVNV